MTVELFANPETPGVSAPLAQLSVEIPTTPAAGTVESYGVSAAAPPALRSASGQFRVLVDHEIMLVTAKVDGSSPWDFERGAEGTTPATHNPGAPIHHVLTRGALATKADLDPATGLLLASQAPALPERVFTASSQPAEAPGALWVINPCDAFYGADSTGTTPSAAAIQLAISWAVYYRVNGGGAAIVALPTGTFLQEMALLMKYGVKLWGASGHGTTFKASATGNFTNGSRSAFPAMVKWDGGDPWAHGVNVCDIDFDTNNVAGLSATWFQSPGELFLFDRLRCNSTAPTLRTVADAQLTAGSRIVSFTASTVTEDDVNAVVDMSGGMAAPPAPALSTAAAGGTIGRVGGTQSFTVGITYLTADGETAVSTTATVVVPAGVTNTITIASPAAAAGATGWFAYVSQPSGGGVMTRQQAPGAPTAIGTDLTLTAPPTNTGATPYTKVDRVNWADPLAVPVQATAPAVTLNNPAAATIANASVTIHRPTDAFVFDGTAATGRIGTLNGVLNSGALLRLKNFAAGTWLIDELSGDDNQGGILRLSAASNGADPAHCNVQQIKCESDYYNANWMWSHDPPVLLDRCGPVALTIGGGSFAATGYSRSVVRLDQSNLTGNGGGPSIRFSGGEGQNWFNTAFTNIVEDSSTGEVILVSAYGGGHSYPEILWGRNLLTAGGATLAGAAVTMNLADADASRASLKVPTLRPAMCVATANVASRSGLQTIDGYTLLDGDRVLLAAQTTGSQNGMWVAHAGAWKRPTDYAAGGVLTSRSCKVSGGTVYAGTDWTLMSTTSVTIDTDATTWKLTGMPPGDLSSFGGVTTAAGTVLGDKLALFAGYGFGIQPSSLVAYVGSGGGLVVRLASGSGAASSGADALRLSPNGTVTGTGLTLDFTDADKSRANLKVPVLRHAQAVAVANVASLSGLQTIDSYTLVDGDRVLLTAQSTAAQNGPWLAHSGAWTRPNEYAAGAVLTSRSIKVSGGTTYAGTDWLLQSTASITVDTDATVWVRTGWKVGAGIATSGNTLSVDRAYARAWRVFAPFTQSPDVTYNAATWLTAYDSQAMMVSIHYNTSGLQNDGGAWKVSLAPGTWSMRLWAKKNTTYAIATIDFSTDGGANWTSIGTTDLYAAAQAIANVLFTGIVVADADYVLVRFRALTRNASSTGWLIPLTAMDWTRTA